MIPGNIAGAAPPIHGSFAFTADFLDPDYCAADGLVLTVHQVESGDFVVFLNVDGSLNHAILHHDVEFSISANGHTLNERDRYESFFAADGSERRVGDSAHILGDHGIVLHDSGQVVFNADGSIAYIHGPHPQLQGATFCSALL